MGRRRKRIEKLLQRPTRMRFEEVVKVLEDFGFAEVRTRGSHVWFAKKGAGQISIPRHEGRWVERAYLDEVRRLLKLDGIDLDDLERLLGREHGE